MPAHIIGTVNPGAISHHTSIVFHDKMYLYGGSKGNCEPNEKMYSLDMKSSPYKWEIIEPIPIGDHPKTRDEHSACLYDNNSMVIFGGFVNGVRTNEVYRYHFNSRKWELLKPVNALVPQARAAQSAIAYKDLLIIFGGKDEDNEKLNDVWAFHLKTNTWECL